MIVWVPFVFAAGCVFGWLIAYPLGRGEGYHQGAVDALDAEDERRDPYLEQFDRELWARTTPDVISRLTHDIHSHDGRTHLP